MEFPFESLKAPFCSDIMQLWDKKKLCSLLLKCHLCSVTDQRPVHYVSISKAQASGYD
jgi:hypothetical protein